MEEVERPGDLVWSDWMDEKLFVDKPYTLQEVRRVCALGEFKYTQHREEVSVPVYVGAHKPYHYGENLHYSSVEDLRRHREYEEKYDADYELYTTYVNSVIEHIPYDKLSIKGLQVLCHIRGISTSGTTRENLVLRLQMFEEGLFVVAKKPSKFEPPVFKNQYSNSLIGLPHFLLQHLLQFADVASLFQLLLVCKYLYQDAYRVLQQKAFEEYKDESVLCFKAFEWLLMMGNGKYKHNLYLLEHEFGVSLPYNLRREAQKDGVDYYARELIKLAVNRYGGVVNMREELKAQKLKEENLLKERNKLLESMKGRIGIWKDFVTKLTLGEVDQMKDPMLIKFKKVDGGCQATVDPEHVRFIQFINIFFHNFQSLSKAYVSGKKLDGLEKMERQLQGKLWFVPRLCSLYFPPAIKHMREHNIEEPTYMCHLFELLKFPKKIPEKEVKTVCTFYNATTKLSFEQVGDLLMKVCRLDGQREKTLQFPTTGPNQKCGVYVRLSNLEVIHTFRSGGGMGKETFVGPQLQAIIGAGLTVKVHESKSYPFCYLEFGVIKKDSKKDKKK
jgi:hypothetical protein